MKRPAPPDPLTPLKNQLARITRLETTITRLENQLLREKISLEKEFARLGVSGGNIHTPTEKPHHD